MRRGGLYRWLLLMGLGYGAPAHAHPFGDTYLSHQVILRVDAERLELDYTLEVPTADVMKAFYAALSGRAPSREEDARFTQQRLDNIVSNIQVNANGHAIAMQNHIDPAKKNGYGNMNFFVYFVSLRAEGMEKMEKAATVALEVTNATDQGLDAFYDIQLYARQNVRIQRASWWESKGETPVQDGASNWEKRRGLKRMWLEYRVARGSAGDFRRVLQADREGLDAGWGATVGRWGWPILAGVIGGGLLLARLTKRGRMPR